MIQESQGALTSYDSTSRYFRTDFAAARIDDFDFAHDVAYSTFTQSPSSSGPKYVYDN
jgi:hypothetical protein